MGYQRKYVSTLWLPQASADEKKNEFESLPAKTKIALTDTKEEMTDMLDPSVEVVSLLYDILIGDAPNRESIRKFWRANLPLEAESTGLFASPIGG